MVLKRKLGRRSWAMEAIVEAVCKGRGSGSLGRRRSSWIDHELVTNLLQFSFEMATNFATIGPRSRHDRATILVLVIRLSPSDRLEKISLRQLLDYGAIAEFFHASSGLSDEDRYLMKIRRAREFHAASMEAVRSRSHDLQLMMIGRFSRGHVAIGEPSDRRHLS